MGIVKWMRPAAATAALGAVTAVVAAPASATPVTEAPAPTYRVIDLGTLAGASDSVALAVNDRGDVVGQSGARAVLWRHGRIVDLGTLGGASSAADVNERGDIVGSSQISGGDAYHAVLWRHGRMIDLGTFPGDESSFATAVNDRGEVLGFSSGAGIRAVLWRPNGTMVDLTARTGLQRINDLDNSGRFVGEVSADGMNSFPALWQHGRTTVLSDKSGTASAINDRGEITGYFYVGTAGSFGWARGRLTEIPLLPDLPPAGAMQAQGINNRGQVVGYGGVGGFVWDSRSGRLTSLPGLAHETAAYDINNRGQIVGAAGTTAENLEPHAVVLSPQPRPTTR